MQELYVHNQSVVHQFDARVKIIFTLAFIVSIGLTPSRAWPAYILYLTLVVSSTLLSHLSISFVLKRALFALPFVLAAAPLVFTGPPPYITAPSFLSVQVNISSEGLGRFVSITIKSWISVQAAILLAATTRFPDLLFGLRLLKVPKLFIAIIGLMWRYLYVMNEEVTRMIRARTSRIVTASGLHRAGGTLFWRARVTGGMVGSLLLRSIERSDRVYAAMISRGYDGEPPAMDDSYPLSRENRKMLLLGLIILIFLWLLGVITGG